MTMKTKVDKKRSASFDPAVRKYMRDFESGRRNPDNIKCRFVLADGTVIDRPIELTPAGNVAKADRGMFNVQECHNGLHKYQ